MAKPKQKRPEGNWTPTVLKADKNFRMSKQTKRLLALMSFPSAELRNSYRRAMINAQLASEAAARAPLGGKKDREDVSA
jgi:hypothetical protein